MYYRILSDLLKGYWSPTISGPYFDAVQAATGLGTAGIKSFLTTTANAVKNSLTAVTSVPFRISTNSGNDIQTENAKIDLEGDAPVQLEAILYSVNDREPVLLDPTWTTHTHWKKSFDLVDGANALVLQGFDSTGALAKVTGITVFRGPAGSLPTVTDWQPRTGSDQGGTEVTLTGTKFAAGMTVFFGAAEAASVIVDSATSARVTTPRAPVPFPSGGVVDVQVVFSVSSKLTLTRAFTYVRQKGFIRGDSNGNLKVELGDAIQTLFYLYGGQPIACVDAADFNDSGSVGITDVVATLDFLFRQGTAPQPPYPTAGDDPTADSFVCQ